MDRRVNSGRSEYIQEGSSGQTLCCLLSCGNVSTYVTPSWPCGGRCGCPRKNTRKIQKSFTRNQLSDVSRRIPTSFDHSVYFRIGCLFALHSFHFMDLHVHIPTANTLYAMYSLVN